MSGAASIVLGTVVATLAAYLFQLLGGRMLGPAAFAPLTILWTVQFVVMHVLYQPLEQYAIRQIELGRRIDGRFVVGCVGVATLLTAAFVQTTRELFFAGEAMYVWVSGALAVGYAGFALGRAQLAGAHRFHAYGLATGAEGLLRVVAAAAILLVTIRPEGLAWAMAVAPLAVLPWIRRDPGTEPGGSAAGLLLPMIGASLCAQLLIGGAPVAAGFLGADPAAVSIVFVTFACLRGPLWVLQGLVARILPPMTAMVRDGDGHRLRRWSTRLTGSGIGAALVAGPVGAAIGPGLVALLFGPAFRPPAAFTGLVTAGVILSAAGLLSNQMLIAGGRTGPMTVAWVSGLVVATALLLVPGEPELRVGVAFAGGQLVAVAALAIAIRRIFADGRTDPDIASVVAAAPVIPATRAEVRGPDRSEEERIRR